MKNDISGSLDNFFKAVLMRVQGHSQQDPTAILSWAQFAVKHMWERENSCVSRNSKWESNSPDVRLKAVFYYAV